MRWKKILIGLALALVAASVFAASPPIAGGSTSNGVLDEVVTAFQTRASAWQTVIMGAASWLFWTLGTISFTWTMGMMAVRKADIQEFFAEFVKFSIFFGFFHWLLTNGPHFADTIIQSLRKIGENASGTTGMHPSGIVNTGFWIFQNALENITITKPIDSAVNVILGLGVLVLLALIAINLLMLLISAWMLMYAGIFFLGFGGSRWTSDIAINYFKTVLGIGAQLLAMILLVGIGMDLMDSFYRQMGQGLANLGDLGAMLVLCLCILVLSSKLPAMLAGIINGHGIGHVGTTAGGLAGAAMGAAMGGAAVAGAAAAAAGSALVAGGANVAGGAQALMAAFSKANAAESAGASAGSMPAAAGGGAAAGDGAGEGSQLAAAMGSAAGDAGSTGGASSLTSGAAGAGSTTPETGSGGATTKDEADSTGGATGATAGATQVATDSKSGSPAPADGLAPREVPKGSALKTAGAIAAKVGQVAARTSGNLALGAYDVGKGKLGDLKDRMLDRIGQTTGGQIASAIKARAEAGKAAPPTFGENSLSAAPGPVDRESEVAAFRDRT